MGASGHRFGAVPFVLGLALCLASACGGAASTPLDRPATGPSSGDDDNSQGPPDTGSGSSSGGGHEDATVSDDSNPGDDVGSDGGGDAGDDGSSSPPEEAGPPDASSMCGPCMPGDRCCTVPGTVSYGQCYSVLCGPCCF